MTEHLDDKAHALLDVEGKIEAIFKILSPGAIIDGSGALNTLGACVGLLFAGMPAAIRPDEMEAWWESVSDGIAGMEQSVQREGGSA